MQKWTICVGTAVLTLFTGAAHAQDPNATATDGPATKLDRITVTAPLRRESTLERSTSSVTVINEQQIKQSAAPDLPSLLADYAGVSVTTNGGMGAVSNVSLRGTNSAQTLVLVDGVRISSATSGGASIYNIPLDSIERIEIAKGAHSAQYGSDAIGGVINIITKQGGSCADGRAACGSVTAGVMHPWGGYLSGNIQGQNNSGMNYAIGGTLLGTEGYDFTLPTYFGHEPDKDGFLQGSVNFSLSKDFDWGRFYADSLFARGRSEYDNAPYTDFSTGKLIYPDNEQYTTTVAGRIGARFDHSDSWFSKIELYSGADDQKNFRRGYDSNSRFNTWRYGIFASTQKTFHVGAVTHTLLGGIEAYREHIDTSTDYVVNSRSVSSAFGQYSFDYKRLHVDTGIRYDHNSQFGDATTYNIGASYELVPGLSLRSSYGTGFRAPTFNELYYPGPFAPGNPDLKPETSRSYEIGLNWQPNAATAVDLAFYRTWITDAIVSDPPLYVPYNTDQARITGFEATLSHRFNIHWSGKISADVRQPLDKSSGIHGKYLSNSDRFKATAQVTYRPTDALDLTARLHYGMTRYIYEKDFSGTSFTTTKLPDYITADFVANYAFDAQSQLRFAVENIFDEKYQTTKDYRAPGRTFDVSLTRTF